MSVVSNFLLRRNDGDAGRDFTIRPVRREEVSAALRLVLAGAVGTGDEASVAEFLHIAVARGLDVTSLWVIADANDQLQWAALPLPLAGRAMLVMVPPRLRPGLASRHVAELVESTLLEPRRAGATIAQALVDPEHRAVSRALVDSGFEDVAELVYLARRVTAPPPGRGLPDTYRLWRYDRSTHARFARAIERSYEGSLDCPQLNGRRDIDDIIAGHKAAGEFDPELWILLSDLDNTDLGVMLLNRLHGHAGYELVYIGLVPEARGQRLADGLIRHAIATLAGEGGGQFITACDADNAPARKLYHRHGFGHIYARRALVKTLA